MDVLSVNYQSPTAPQDFARSLKNTGFAVLTNHPLPWGKIEKVYAEWREFFKSPERFNYPFDKKTQDGYVPASLSEVAKGEVYKDIKEFYHMYYPWGRYPSCLSSATREVFEEAFELARQLLVWIEQALPPEIKNKLRRPLSSMICRERTLQRILYYPPITGLEEVGAIRAAAHEDINLITILPAATAPGLEAKDAQGQWHAVKIDPKSLVINIGDMLQEATDYYYISTSHRVVKPEGEIAGTDRLSLPHFIHAHAEDYLSPAYPTAKLYLDERLRELGLLSPEEKM